MTIRQRNERTLRETSCPSCGSTCATFEIPWQEYQLVRCGECDLVYSDRMDVPGQLYDEAYDQHRAYQGYLEQARAEAGSLHVAWAWRHFLKFARVPGSLLDIGCATGAFLRVAKSRGWSTSGIDISPAAAEVARQAAGADVRSGTLETHRYPANSFDAVTGWEVLEHVPRPTEFAAEIFRILRPGGVLALSTPNWRSRWERMSQDDNRRPPYHLTFWSPSPATRLLSRAGFTEVVALEKPIAWSEEVGRWKWLYLPVAIGRSVFLGQRGNRLLLMARKPVEGSGEPS